MTKLHTKHIIMTGLACQITCLAVGCAGAKMAEGVKDLGEPPAGSEREIAAITEDPVAYMRKSLTEARKVRTARITFHRQERLGLVPELRPLERMNTEFREEPFSVKFTWLDDESDYLQAVYVQGKNDNKVALLPRRGLFGGKGRVVSYPANFAVTFQKSKKPVTDFGPRLMLERLFDRVEKAKVCGGAKIKYVGASEVGPAVEKCHHIELIFPKDDEYPCKLIDLYVNMHTRVPVACYLWLTAEERERTSKTLDAMYIYGDMKHNVPLSDDDFLIEPAPEKKSSLAGKTPGKRQISRGGAEDAETE